MIDLIGNFISEVMVGLVGGGVVSAIIYGKGYLERRKLMQKYPLAGKYITKYEDIENGQKVMTTALATLRQRGRKLTGETRFGSQKWLIEAEISDMGNIYGIYRAENPNDRGVGNLFLSINTDFSMHGIWSGFDEENDAISSGKYSFRPIAKDVEIVNAKKKHWSRILQISDCELGKDYISDANLSKIVDDESYLSRVAVINGKVVGFAIAKTVGFADLETLLKVERTKIPRFLSVNDKIGYISVVAVGRSGQGVGIGFKLVKDLVDTLEEDGITSFCCTAWKNSDRINVGNILKSLDFEEGITIENYWTEDSIQNKYDCPECGNPCKCSAVMFFRS
jgi:ribosomal protein S18 acetylase RimI-like enzyme